MSQAGFVYLIWAEGTDKYKIGVTTDLEKRVAILQTGCPARLRIISFFKTEDMLAVESGIHAKWCDFQILGEWHQIPPTEISKLLSEFRDPQKTLSLNEISEFQRKILPAPKNGYELNENSCFIKGEAYYLIKTVRQVDPFRIKFSENWMLKNLFFCSKSSRKHKWFKAVLEKVEADLGSEMKKRP